jgi:hypothetical protein
MVKIANQKEIFDLHEHSNGLKYYRYDYFKKEEDINLSPQSYLIKQLPNITNPTHFHIQNQFQVFVGGSGSFGRHPIEPYIVHYAGAYTGYGPIVASTEGLNYLTLRARRDPGAKFLPEQRDLFISGPRRHYTSRQFIPSDKSIINALKQPEFSWDHFDSEIRLGVGLLKMPSFSSYVVKPEKNSDGIFLVVIGGEISVFNERIGVNQNVFISASEISLEIKTSDGYAELLVLQMPEKELPYTS